MKLRLIFYSLVVLNSFTGVAQEYADEKPNKKPDVAYQLTPRFLKIGFGFETDIKPNAFASIEYFFSPGKQRVYYMGFQMDIMNSQKDGYGSHVKRNELGQHNNVAMTNLELVQKFYLKSMGRVTPYFNFSGGLRFMGQDVYDLYQTTIPIVGIPAKAQDSLYENQMRHFSFAFGTGVLVRLDDNFGINFGFDVRKWKSFDMYLDEHRKSTFCAISLGMQLGFDRRRRPARR